MKYLLDVNALLAWHHADSPHHEAFHRWSKDIDRKALATCALTELGFLRVSMQVFHYTRAQAQSALASLRSEAGDFIGQAPPPVLPAWVKGPAQTTDAYLAQLAAAHECVLATFDRRIPDAVMIR